MLLHCANDISFRNRLLESKVEELEGSGAKLQSKYSGASEETIAKTQQIDKLQRKLLLVSKVSGSVDVWCVLASVRPESFIQTDC